MLSLKGIVKRWTAHAAPVLDQVDLDLRRGTVVAVAGRNGTGKTTLLRIAAGLLTPEAGEARLLGLDPERDRTEYNRRLGFLAAGNTGLYARLNVEQHLDLWARLALMTRLARLTTIAEVSAVFELHALSGRRVDRLSMGQRQRLRLALTFLHRPEVVLLDEPYTSLDADGVDTLRVALEGLRDRGGAAVLCSPEPHRGLAHDQCYTIGAGHLEEARWDS